MIIPKLDTDVYGKVAQYWRPLHNNRVQCTLCPRLCNIPDGARGFCYVRENINGTLYLTSYGHAIGFNCDPIEKKPFYHFYPGSKIYSFGLIGCNMACMFCQNWHLTKYFPPVYEKRTYAPQDILYRAVKNDCIGLAFTYNEPITSAEWLAVLAHEAKEQGMKSVMVSNGYINPEARETLFKNIDAVNIDLKGFNDFFYQRLTHSHLQPVLDTLEWLVHETNIWVEITNLIIPSKNDSAAAIAQLTEYVATRLSPLIPIHFNAFHPDFKMMDLPKTPFETLEKARDIALKNGLNHVYIGNALSDESALAKQTYCATCGEVLIRRSQFDTVDVLLKDGHCPNCGAVLNGLFN
ncbi:Radical SAM domain protein [Chloroherpeton thalassium ATCC 35110]|uniref:Radical SAM domain protein n=1 Tax=Chloroherpeton thalassium (strain ATCC 35110 / GB-78) TaxID=517418 RepID=B3QUP7_CHLT3|nr:AmmeMemoRadiSam system radical SAM enzyme [Chloroherpeton thalassium]ACF12953.1 Radical SAM domain protein [Chloroherpeton thalassium ATCC 35110]